MPERPLPELTPEMLLSYGGMREFEGAQAMQRRPPPSMAVVHDDQVDALREMVEVAAADNDFYVSFDRDDGSDADTTSNFRTPAVGNRFNVMRPPVREPFRPPPSPGHQQSGNMREVGRVGRFAILTE